MLTLIPSHQQVELAIRELPTGPRILAQLASRLRSVDVDVSDVTAIVKRDSGLAGVLLNAANSAAYCGFEAATTIEDAVARLGYRETHRILGSAVSSQLADGPLSVYHVNARRLRENSLFCALVMEDLAVSTRIDSGTAYTIGLLRSIGKVVLDRVAREYGATPFDPENQSLLDWEHANWSVSNAEVAARALEVWGFPESAVDALRHHLAPRGTQSREAHILHLAAGAAELHGLGLPGESTTWHDQTDTMRRADLEASHVHHAVECAAERVLNLSAAFA